MSDQARGGPSGAHLVGTIPLGDAETVFRTTASILGDRLRRVTDGETGGRLNWIGWQLEVLLRHPQLEIVAPDPGAGPPYPRVRLLAGVGPSDLSFDELGYAREAKASYATFRRLQADGVVPAHWRFQVSLPTPLAPIAAFVMPEHQADAEAGYEDAMRREVEAILDAIPHDALAMQWDTAVEIRMLEGVTPPYFADMEEGIRERLARYGGWVPDDVPLGYHLCYGDEDHQRFADPKDTSVLTSLANQISASLERDLDWIHMPVPRERDDLSYFEPLSGLTLGPSTELFLGLIHYTDGTAGTQVRIATARRVVLRFGVATACGMGRRPEETIPRLLEIHAEVSEPVA